MHSNRFESLDGIRGVAALIVVVFHFLSAFIPSVVPEQSSAVPLWADSPFAILYNGTFAVPVFFVLSGFVLAHASMRVRDNLPLDIILRYVRLAVPATASILFAWILLSLFPTATQDLAIISPSRWLQWTYQGDIPSLYTAFLEGFFGIFRNGKSGFNNVLWTMPIELIGSFGIYFFFQFITRYRMALCTVAVILLIIARVNVGYVAFALGAIIYLLHRQGLALTGRWGTILFILGLVIGSWSTGFAARHFALHFPGTFEPGNKNSLWYPFGASCIVAGVLCAPQIAKLFCTSICQFLGRISFPMYLIHVPIIYTLVAASAVHFNAIQGMPLLILAIISLVAVFFLASVFERFVDQPTMILIRKIRRSRPPGTLKLTSSE
jgi:peptidoglycan/LPS O-acetylase OafA/YrhL